MNASDDDLREWQQRRIIIVWTMIFVEFVHQSMTRQQYSPSKQRQLFRPKYEYHQKESKTSSNQIRPQKFQLPYFCSPLQFISSHLLIFYNRFKLHTWPQRILLPNPPLQIITFTIFGKTKPYAFPRRKKNISQPNSQIRYSLKGDLLLPLKIFGSSHCNNTVIHIILQATSEFPSNYRYWEFGFACSILCRLVIKGE